MIIKYFKHEAESEYGEGHFYIETIDGWATRQIEIYKKNKFWADQNNKSNPDYELCDQPLKDLGLSKSNEIPKQEFEDTWKIANNK